MHQIRLANTAVPALRGPVVLLCLALALAVTPTATSAHGAGRVGYSRPSTAFAFGTPRAASPGVWKSGSHLGIRRAAKAHFKKVSDGYQLTEASAVVAHFTVSGLSLSSPYHGDWSLGIRPAWYGRQSKQTKIAPVQPVLVKATLEYNGKAFQSWYRSPASGLEQGFTIRKPPKGTGPLAIGLSETGSLRIIQAPDGSRVEFVAGSRILASYQHLSAVDARGKHLRVTVSASGSAVQLHVVDKHAAYPVHVDPFFYCQEILSPEPSDVNFGQLVSLSGDGGTAIIGGMAQNHTYAAYVYTKTESGYVATNGVEGGGRSVALSRDGKVALGGGVGREAYVSTYEGPALPWNAQPLDPSDPENDKSLYGSFGSSVALSDDGAIAVVGAIFVDDEIGAAYVFARQDDGTYQQVARLQGADGASDDQFGSSVAVSGDGSTILVGAVYAHYQSSCSCMGPGEAYVFSRSGSTYTQTSVLTPPDGLPISEFGQSVALSEDGSEAVIGSPDHNVGANHGQGSVYVFRNAGSGWEPPAELDASDGAPDNYFGGGGIGLSSDGRTILVGALSKDGNTGADYVFRNDLGSWSQTAELTATDNNASGNFGSASALSSDGQTALVGAPFHNGGVGSAYAFTPDAGLSSTSVALSAGTNPSTAGDTLTFTASVTAVTEPGPTGTVEFWDGQPGQPGSTDLGPQALSAGQASLTISDLPAGQHDIYAVYDGDSAYIGSQGLISQEVDSG